MKTKLITALRTAATALEQDTFAYDWDSPASCNCGIIASTIMHKSIAGIAKELPEYEMRQGSWRDLVKRFCPVTGLSENSVIRAMQEVGMSRMDIVQLERLSNPEVIKRMGMTKTQNKQVLLRTDELKVEAPITRTFWQWITRRPIQFNTIIERFPVYRTETFSVPAEPTYDKKEHVIAYMRAWADLLTEQGREDTVEGEPSTMPASVN